MHELILSLQRIGYRTFLDKGRERNVIKRKMKSVLIVFIQNILKVSNFSYGAFVPITAKIGKNIKFQHSLHGIFISQNAIIGDNCTILHHVTIGSVLDKKGKLVAPKIGNNVYIGCNSSIIGNTIIGDNCKIGAGTTIVNGTIPSNTTIVGQKWRVIDENSTH